MAQVASGTDATQRLFQELRSKNNEVRQRASSELYDTVVALSRGNEHAVNIRYHMKLTVL